MPIKKLNIIIVLVALAILLIGLYYPVLYADYVWDDTLLFVSKTGLLTEPLSWELIAEPVLPGTTYFRPLVFLTWFAEFHAFGQHANISHIIGLIVFYINVVLVFVLAVVLAHKTKHAHPLWVGIVASLLYLLHPALVESSAWVSGRFDQFATLFSLLACFIFVRYFDAKKGLSVIPSIVIALSFLCALFSKELGLVLPFILLCLYFSLGMQHQPSKWQLLKQGLFQYKILYISLIVVMVFYFILRLHSMSHLYHDSISINYIENAIIKNWMPLQALKFYLIETFFPFSSVNLLHPLRDWDFTSIKSRMGALLSACLMIVVMWYAWVRQSISAWLGIAAFISILLVLYIIPISIADNIGHERFMTLSLAFVAIAVAIVPYQHILKKLNIQARMTKLIVSLLLIGWLTLSAFTVKSIIPFWHNDFSLWMWAYKSHPNEPIARYNYLYGALSIQNFQLVVDECEKYIKKHGGLEVSDQFAYASALTNMKNQEGLSYFEGVMYALPKFHEMSDKDARKHANTFLMTAGQMGGVYASYANALLMFKGDVAGALENLKIADWYFLADEKETLRYHMAAALYANGNYEKSKKLYKEQLRISVKNNSHSYLATYQILDIYCKKQDEKPLACIKMRQEQPFLTVKLK
jgi:hypothetical protein